MFFFHTFRPSLETTSEARTPCVSRIYRYLTIFGTLFEGVNFVWKYYLLKSLEKFMLETIIVIVLVLWLLGLIAGQTFGGILHALLLVAVVIFIIRLLTGRRAV